MGLISWIVVGLIAGLLAKWIMPGEGPGGLLIALILGMAGASIGGFVVSLLGGTGATGFNVWSILVATFGAIILLFLYGLIARRTA
ncbi:MAG: GlsB/YeaQ/YmgE family stress response membrane protein [Actinomycetota bacterium]|nr:GlsB/YeaQ/YmgE family stress response membrane protein [Actinomycetota bacterium]